jgi:autotransporter-associated beta strand protein
MKTTPSLRNFLLGSALLAVVGTVNAQSTYYWDSNNGTTGFGNTDGTWSATTTGATNRGWTTAATGNVSLTVPPSSVTTTTSDTVNFGTAANAYGTGTRTITVNSTVNVGTLVFGNTSIRTETSGGTINFGANGVITGNTTAGSGVGATIGSTITGAETSLTINGGAGTAVGNVIHYLGTLSGSRTVSIAANTRWDQSAAQTTGENLTYNVDGTFGIRDLVLDSTRTSMEIGELTGSGVVSGAGASNDGFALVIGGKNTSSVFSGAINGNATVEKVGAGTLTLSSTNNYTGATTVSAGTLEISPTGSTNVSSAVSVSNSNSTLIVNGTVNGTLAANVSTIISGSGTIAGATTIAGTLSPGASPGTLTFGNTLALGNTSTAFMEIDGNLGAGVTEGHDLISLTGVGAAGVLTYDGAMTLDIGSIFGTGSYSWNLFNFASEAGAFDSISLADKYTGSLSDLDTNGVWDLTSGSNTWSFTESTGVLALTVIPEPGAALLGSLGLLALLRRRR